MSEIHSNLYVNHPDQTVFKKLVQLLNAFSESKDNVLSLAVELNPGNGTELVQQLFSDLEQKYHEDVLPESVWETQGYAVIHLVNGSSGDHVVGRLVKFLYGLCPCVNAQAWGCGDDDPWEFWFKYEKGRLLRRDDEPMMGGDDQYIKDTIYRWWHEGLPEGLIEGFLNANDDEEVVASDDCGVRQTEEEYQQWVRDLRSRSQDGGVNQEIEPTVNADMFRDVLGALGDLFSSAIGDVDKKAHTHDAINAEELSEQIVLDAHEEIHNGFRTLNASKLLRHISKNLSGHTEMLDEDVLVTVPSNYAMYKLGLSMILKPKTQFKYLQSNVHYEAIDNTKAQTYLSADVQYIDPETKKLMKTTSEERYVWQISDGKLMVTEMYSKELEKVFIEG